MVFVSDSSGRFLTSYTPTCVDNQKIKQEFGLTNDYDYRMFLQRNADKVMKFKLKNMAPQNKLICDCPRCNLISEKHFFNKRQNCPKVKKAVKQMVKAKVQEKVDNKEVSKNVQKMVEKVVEKKMNGKAIDPEKESPEEVEQQIEQEVKKEAVKQEKKQLKEKLQRFQDQFNIPIINYTR